MLIITFLVGVLGSLMIAFAISMTMDMRDTEQRIKRAWVAASASILAGAGAMLVAAAARVI